MFHITYAASDIDVMTNEPPQGALPLTEHLVQINYRLGKARAAYIHRQRFDSHSDLVKLYEKGRFRIIEASAQRTKIIELDGELIGYRVSTDCVKTINVNQTLCGLVKEWPQVIRESYGAAVRGQVCTRHYTVWTGYAKDGQPFQSKDYTHDGEGACKFVERTQLLWSMASTILRDVSSKMKRKLDQYQLSAELH
jgi:hypothetical protein